MKDSAYGVLHVGKGETVPEYFMDKMADRSLSGLPSIYRLLIRSPHLAMRWVELANYLRFDSELDDRTRELVVVYISQKLRCRYEGYHHRKLAIRAGWSEEELDKLSILDERERLAPPFNSVLAAVDCCLAREPISTEIVNVLAAEFGEVVLVDLVAVITYYIGLAHLLEAMAVPVEIDEE